MSKREVFDKINKWIQESNGIALKLNSKLVESRLDGLGYLLLFLSMDKDYGIFKDIPNEEKLSSIDVNVVTTKQLINRCVLSNATNI